MIPNVFTPQKVSKSELTNAAKLIQAIVIYERRVPCDVNLHRAHSGADEALRLSVDVQLRVIKTLNSDKSEYASQDLTFEDVHKAPVLTPHVLVAAPNRLKNLLHAVSLAIAECGNESATDQASGDNLPLRAILLDAPNFCGETAMHCAVTGGHVASVDQLLQYSASTKLPDQFDNLPRDVALMLKNKATSELQTTQQTVRNPKLLQEAVTNAELTSAQVRHPVSQLMPSVFGQTG